MFTGYIQLQPIKLYTPGNLIEALLKSIVRPFGFPRFNPSASETSLFSNKEFYKFLFTLGIEYLPRFIGAPYQLVSVIYKEELHFGVTCPSHQDLFQVWPDKSNPI
jgi:hypothetical protein